jgi:hypothetical protein
MRKWLKTIESADWPQPLIERFLFWRSGIELSDAKIADCIHKMSEAYIFEPNQPTPWNQTWAQVAQKLYFYPLNYLRNYQVLQEWKIQPPKQSIEHFIDLGAGLSPTLDVLLDHSVDWISLKQVDLIDRSPIPKSLRKDWAKENQKIPLFFHDSLSSKLRSTPKSLLSLSYSAVEMSSWPENLPQTPHLWFIEPSVKAAARKLQNQREVFLEKGYSIVAPCTHSQSCPLLQRENDWCHSRIYYKAPREFAAIEEHLRIKNSNLTFSYLLLSRTELIDQKISSSKRGRLVSDLFVEKGKLRQTACESETSFNFSWLDRDLKDAIFQEAPQGALYLSPPESHSAIGSAKNQSEVRLKTPLEIVGLQRNY